MSAMLSSTSQRADAFAEYFEDQFQSGEFPHLQAFADGDLRASMKSMADKLTDDRRFERGLQMLLDGIELDLKKRRRESRGRARTSGARAGRRASG